MIYILIYFNLLLDMVLYRSSVCFQYRIWIQTSSAI